MQISAAVEGDIDEAVAIALIRHVGAEPGPIYGKRGKDNIRRRFQGWSYAARYAPWLILVDLDNDFDCAPPLRKAWKVPASPFLCFRVAVREVESWLLADADRMAQYLHIRPGLLPADPDLLDHPKRHLVDLTNRSTKPTIKEQILPRPGSGRVVGPGYAACMLDLVQQRWRPEVAAERSHSLRRAIACLRSLTEI